MDFFLRFQLFIVNCNLKILDRNSRNKQWISFKLHAVSEIAWWNFVLCCFLCRVWIISLSSVSHLVAISRWLLQHHSAYFQVTFYLIVVLKCKSNVIVHCGVNLNKKHLVDGFNTVLGVSGWLILKMEDLLWVRVASKKRERRRKYHFFFFKELQSSLLPLDICLQAFSTALPLQTLSLPDADWYRSLQWVPGLWLLTEFSCCPACKQHCKVCSSTPDSAGGHCTSTL